MSLSGYRRSGLRVASIVAIAALTLGFASSAVAAPSPLFVQITCAVGGNTTASWVHFGPQTATVSWYSTLDSSFVATTGPFTVHGKNLSVPTNPAVTSDDHVVVDLSSNHVPTLSTNTDCL